MAKKTISVTLEPSTIDSLHRLAAADYRNISNMIDYIVAQYVISRTESSAVKNARASVFADRVRITPYPETQDALMKNVRIDADDLDFIKDPKA
ncbi:MAG: hypothetical protein J5592_06265 [Clostridia bacterium]|jgi:hypothetical protein|nr:hypothetical protein [Clostridia bacterium]MBO4791873.1 hypothetical protein [Clostridia bacterium]